MNIDERAASLVGDMPWITEHLTDAQIGDMKRQIAASMRALARDRIRWLSAKLAILERLAERKDGGE